MSKFSSRLKELREYEQLGYAELGQELGVSGTAIARWENGKRISNIESLYTIAKFFGVSSDYLLGLED